MDIMDTNNKGITFNHHLEEFSLFLLGKCTKEKAWSSLQPIYEYTCRNESQRK